MWSCAAAKHNCWKSLESSALNARASRFWDKSFSSATLIFNKVRIFLWISKCGLMYFSQSASKGLAMFCTWAALPFSLGPPFFCKTLSAFSFPCTFLWSPIPCRIPREISNKSASSWEVSHQGCENTGDRALNLPQSCPSPSTWNASSHMLCSLQWDLGLSQTASIWICQAKSSTLEKGSDRKGKTWTKGQVL